MITDFQQATIEAVERVYPRHVVRPKVGEEGVVNILGMRDDVVLLNVNVPPAPTAEDGQGYGTGMYIRWRDASDVIEQGWATGTIVKVGEESLGVVPDTINDVIWMHKSEGVEIIKREDLPMGQPTWRCSRGDGCVMGVDQCAIANRCLWNETAEADEGGEEVNGEVEPTGPLHLVQAALLALATQEGIEAARLLREAADMVDPES